MELCKQVESDMLGQGVDMAGLARRIGYRFSTTRNVMLKRSPPSTPITAKLRALLAEPPGQPAAAPAPANGQAAPDEAKALAARLRAKRRPLPLTGTTLAATIGRTPEELDDALHGRAAGGLGGPAERLA